MRFCIPFLIVLLIALVAQSSAAQKKDEAATAKRIAEIQRKLRGLKKNFAQLSADMAEPPETRRKGNFQKEMEHLLDEMALLRAELRGLQPAAKPNIKTGVHVSCALEVTPVKRKMIPELIDYGEGATIRILTTKDKKILAEGQTDAFGEVLLAVPPGKHLLEVIPRPRGSSGAPIEVTVEKDKVTAVAVIMSISAR